MIKHISFDLWLTLIKSHPEFKLKRAEMIAETFGIQHIDASGIDKFVRSIDKTFDRYNMISGKKLSANAMYCRLLQRIVSGKKITEREAIEVRKKADRLFEEYCPQFVNENIPDILSQLKEEGYSINLSSNTGFIEGIVLRNTLAHLNIIQYFDFLIFSDEIDASKPSSRFFEKVNEQVNVKPDEVLHIGDNPKADYQGAINFGFKALLITNHDYTIHDIRTGL
ncbi:MAG: HAD family hydrolase [Dysgonomonas sp.]|nr:HAD family hydrolase [Dysgonomonas sp.]